jgi:hypothetical protein
VLFSSDVVAARQELLDKKLFKIDQIEIAN